MLVFLEKIECPEERDKVLQIYYRYKGLMFYAANKILNSKADAEDAVHQAFVSIIENLEKILEADDPKTRAYAVVIAEHKAIDIIRARNKISGDEFDEEICGMEIPMCGDNKLAEAMAKLPARYRDTLILRYADGYDTEEIASMLGMKRDTVQKLIWRAKVALAKIYDGEAEKTV